LLTGVTLLYFLIDYQYNTVAESLFPDEKELMAFFAFLMAVYNVVAMVIQVGLLNKLMHWLGVGGILVAVPAGLVVSSGQRFYKAGQPGIDFQHGHPPGQTA